jgi:hypothetical protein
MYICYVDESGHCGVKEDPAQPVEVLCGVITDLTKLTKTQREHSELLTDLGIAEMKASDAYRGRKEWSAVPPAERDGLFDTVMAWADERKAKFIVCPVDSQKFFSRKASGCAICQRLQYPYEAGALNVLLAVQRLQQGKKSNKGRTLVVFDEQKDHDQRLLQLIAGDLSFTDGFTDYRPRPRAKQQARRLDQIIDVPFFSKSHLATMIQVADWAAFVVNQHLQLSVYGRAEKYVGEREKLERWYRGIEANAVPSAATAPTGSDVLRRYYRADIRPNKWAGSHWP